MLVAFGQSCGWLGFEIAYNSADKSESSEIGQPHSLYLNFSGDKTK